MIAELTQEEIEELLRRQTVGRVGCHVDGLTYVVPVIYVWQDGCVYVQSVEGQKIRMMRQNPRVCFEVDEYAEGGSWQSVIVQGVYEELEGTRAEEALALLVQRFLRRRPADGGRARPTAGDRQPVAFRIRSLEVTGRKVTRPGQVRALSRVGLALTRWKARRRQPPGVSSAARRG